ncbi:MAG: NapC/NirT family cytochrome c [Vicinamibacteria bacterium]
MLSVSHNRLSWAGGALALLAAVGIVFFAAFDHFSTRGNPYWGIFAWVLFPAIMFAGALLFAFGAMRERARRRSGQAPSLPAFPVWDFNIASARWTLLIALGAIALFLPISAVGSYRAYEMSESVSFCGNTCHTSMEPEATSFSVSAHSATKCVDCHVGPGPSGYVQAKASGVRRMWKAMTNTFGRPILSPLQTIPDSSGTCASCHARSQAAGQALRTFAHYAYDETNTPRQIELLMNIGGTEPGRAPQGIHAHQSKKIEYGYLDPSFQTIAWVRVINTNGTTTEYRSDDPKVTREIADKAPRRLMDCADCHNRIGHTFETPDRAVNLAMLHGRLDPSLPFLKKEAVDLLSRSYATAAEGQTTIARDLRAFYAKDYQASASANEPKIVQAIAELQRIHSLNMFPEMKATWETFPNNIGHFSSPGCFRCHGGNMKTSDGKVISKDCQMCHTVQGQSEGRASLLIAGKEFVHPIDMGDLKDATCADCHTGKGIAQ